MQEKSRWKNEGKFEKMKAEIIDVLAESKDEKEIAEAQENLQRYNERQAEIEEYLRRRKILMNHLKNWKENQKKYGLIIFDGTPPSNVSYAELQSWLATADSMTPCDPSLKPWFRETAIMIMNFHK